MSHGNSIQHVESKFSHVAKCNDESHNDILDHHASREEKESILVSVEFMNELFVQVKDHNGFFTTNKYEGQTIFDLGFS